MGKAAQECCQCGRDVIQEAGRRGEGPVLDIGVWAPASGDAGRLSGPWTLSCTNLLLLTLLWVHPFTCKWHSHNLPIVLMSVMRSILEIGALLSSANDKWAIVLGLRHPWGDIRRTMGKMGREVEAANTSYFLETKPEYQRYPQGSVAFYHWRGKWGQEEWGDKARARTGVSATQSHVESKLSSSESKCQPWTTHKKIFVVWSHQES